MKSFFQTREEEQTARKTKM